MPSPIDNGRSNPPSPKRQKKKEEEEIKTSDDSDDEPYYDSDEIPDEELHRWNAEMEKTGPFDIDFSKFGYSFGWKQLDLEETLYNDESKTNRDLIEMLTNMALNKYNAENGSKLELGKIEKVNYHTSAGVTNYISFQAIHDADHQTTRPYQAVVRYLPCDMEVISCKPKPSS